MAARPNRAAIAQWFAELYGRLRIPRGAHLRRIHYVLVSQSEPVVMVDGRSYENTMNCWQTLCAGARDARYLELLPPLSFEDHRSPDAMIQEHLKDTTAICTTLDGAITDRGGLYVYDPPAFTAPTFTLTEPVIAQRYHIEIWCEKSTMDDILGPIARSYPGCVNVVTGVGEMTLTQVEEAVERIRNMDRPVRMLYLSDFDPAGQSMPVAVARKVEFLIRNEDLDIQLESIVLTHDQCTQYRLPRTPIKETEHRAVRFEARYGEGATELDALEALHPGVLRQIVVEHIERFHDADLTAEVRRAIWAFRLDMQTAERDVRAQFADRTAEINRRCEALQREVQAKLDDLAAEIEEEEGELVIDMEELIADMEEAMTAVEPDPDDTEWPEPSEGEDWSDPLFDSRRSYIEQNDRYARFKGREIRCSVAAIRRLVRSFRPSARPLPFLDPTRQRRLRRPGAARPARSEAARTLRAVMACRALSRTSAAIRGDCQTI
jgi:hypothetical protein